MPKFKLDENLPASLVNDLRNAGYDTASVLGEGMSGSTDPHVLAKCQSEGRVLITSFALPLKPSQTYGTCLPGFCPYFSQKLSSTVFGSLRSPDSGSEGDNESVG